MVTLKESNFKVFSSIRTKALWLMKISLLITYITIPQKGIAQMFSVNPEREITTIPMSSVSFGLSFMDFAYRGPDDIISNVPNFSFNDPLYLVSLDVEGFSAFGLFGRKLSNNNNSYSQYSQFGASISNNFVIQPGSVFNVLVPIKIATDYLIITSNDNRYSAKEMKQNTFGIHGGLEIRARLGQQVRFLVGSTAGYGFSVSGFGTSGGSAVDWAFQNRVFIDRLINNFGLTFGFDLKSRKYNLDDPYFNYRAQQQVVVVGVTF